MNTKIQNIIDQINEMATDDLVNLNNAYAENAKYYDEEIYNNDEDFFNTFFPNDPDKAVRAVFYGDFRYNDTFVKFNGYGNLESFNYFSTDDLIESPETIAKFCIEEENDLNGLIQLPEDDE